MLFLVLILTLFCAFYSGSEAAIFSQDAGRLARMRGDIFSPQLRKTIIGWLKRPERIITGLLIGNLIASIALTDLGETWITREFGEIPHRHFVLPVVITLYVLTFGEVVPKIIALVSNELWLRLLNIPLRIWFRITGKFTIPFDRVTLALVKRLRPVRTTLSEAELVEAVRFAEDHGLLSGDEMRMLSRSIAFYHNTVYSAMIPRSQLLLLPEGATTARARKAFQGAGTNFAAIYREKTRDIVGVVYLRGIAQLLLSKKQRVESKVHPVEFLPASLSLSDALHSLMHSRRDLAAVVDEAGAFIGMVTLKGVIDHILGASFTATPQDAYLVQLDNRRYRVSAQMPLDRFNEIFRTNFSADLSETIGGFVLEKMDGFPHAEDELVLDHFIFRNFQVEGHKILFFDLQVADLGRRVKKNA